MFPPESSAHTSPSPPAFPVSSAATDAAPAPSTTSFARSSSSVIASEISSSSTCTRSSSRSSRIDIVSVPGCLTAMPSAIVPRPRLPRLHPDDAHAGPQRAQRDRDPGGEPAAADRQAGRCPTSGSSSASSRPIVPWPAITVASSNACTNVAPVSSARASAATERLVEAAPGEHRLRAVVARRVDLGHRRVLRHEHRRADRRARAPPRRRPGRGCPALAAITPAARCVVAERRELVDRAAHLERRRCAAGSRPSARRGGRRAARASREP